MNVKELKKIGLSHSRLDTWRSGCRKKFWLTINNWVNPNSNRAKNTLFGNLCHFISEQGFHEVAIIEAQALSRKYVRDNQDELTVVDEQEIEHNVALSAIVMHCYYKYQTAYKDYKVLKNELYLKRLKVGNHVFNIKIDKVLQHRKTGEIFILDHKCKSRFDSTALAKKIVIDQQFQLYRKGFETAYHRKVTGLIWDIIRKPGLRKTQKEDYTEFMNRVKADIEKRPEWYFISIPLRLRPEYCEDFDYELDVEMNEIYSCLEKGEKAFTKNTSICDSPFECEFFESCTSGSTNCLIKRF